MLPGERGVYCRVASDYPYARNRRLSFAASTKFNVVPR